MYYKIVTQHSECVDENGDDTGKSLPDVSWIIESDCVDYPIENPIPCYSIADYKNCTYINTIQTLSSWIECDKKS